MDDARTVEVAVGRVGRAHGLRGDVAVDVRTDEPERRFAVGARVRAVRDGTPPRTLTVATSRVHSGRRLVRFEGVEDRTGAEALGGAALVADVDGRERPEDDEEFYDHQLVGLDVVTAEGETVGRVSAVLHLPGQDTLAVERADGPELLVPFVGALVPEIDLDAGRLVVTAVPGLLDPEASA